MTQNWLVGGFAFLLAGLLMVGDSAAQEQAEPKKKSLVEMASEAMDQAAAEAGLPGEYHALLEKMAGSWTYTGKMWEQPDALPMEVSGTSEMRMILDGRYLQQEVTGSFLGQEFNGLGFIGFNKTEGKFETVWMDNMSTALLKSSGTGDLNEKIITTFGELKDSRTGEMKKFKSVTALKGETELLDQWFDIGENGEEMKTMELIYKRK